MTLRKLPIGIQDFVDLRESGYLYVDKTALIYKLVTEGKVYFLSRPRRFGKSLVCSTLGAYFEGKKELFKGLAIEKLETKWEQFPVLRLDLNAEKYDSSEALEIILDSHLRDWESLYGKTEEKTVSQRFRKIIENAHNKTGMRVVVIIDEYDKPLLSTISNLSVNEKLKDILKPFFGVLKSSDSHLKFVFITGVTKFSQVSVFSDLNQLDDLSMQEKYSGLCGLTENEIVENFASELTSLANKFELSRKACLEKIKAQYNGYKFHHSAEGVYNPFSTLNLFKNFEFADYWFQTGTPTFLVELLKKSDEDIRDLEGVELRSAAFVDYKAEPDQPIPVLYQSGYLTIKGYDDDTKLYRLGFPNAEVKYGFFAFLVPDYTPLSFRKGGFHISKFYTEVKAGNVEAFLTRMKAFFADFPYDLNDNTERHYQVVFYLIFKLLGQYIQSEVKSSYGRADAVVSTPDFIFVFEFKLFGTAEEALKQIDDKGYLLPYSADGRKLFKIGVEFDAVKRNLGKWLVV